MEKFNSFLIALVMLPFLLFMGGCKNKTLLIQSKWGQSGFEGIQSLLDRSRPMTYLEDERMNIGVQNDADSLYLILRTSDKNIRNQVKYGGLIIWLDGTANEVKKFGIQYPLGSTFTGIPPSGNKLGGRGEKPHSDSSNVNKLPGEESEPLVNLHTVQILGLDRTVYGKYSANDVPGIQVNLTDTMGTLIYELRVPLNGMNDSSYSIGTEPGQIIAIGIESNRFQREIPPKDTLGNDEPQHMPGIYGRPQGGFSDNIPPPEKRNGRMSAPIGFWIKAELANSGPK